MIFLNIKSQFEKSIHYYFPTLSHFGKGKTMKTTKRSLVARG